MRMTLNIDDQLLDDGRTRGGRLRVLIEVMGGSTGVMEGVGFKVPGSMFRVQHLPTCLPAGKAACWLLPTGYCSKVPGSRLPSCQLPTKSKDSGSIDFYLTNYFNIMIARYLNMKLCR